MIKKIKKRKRRVLESLPKEKKKKIMSEFRLSILFLITYKEKDIRKMKKKCRVLQLLPEEWKIDRH